jgi:hypothetical protein
MRALRNLRGMAVVSIGASAAYGVAFSYRFDYLGHFLAGLGGTLLLLAVVSRLVPRPLGWIPIVLGLVAIWLGATAEATLFRVAIFDPVDFCNQSLGAAFAVCGVIGLEGSRELSRGLLVLGGLVLAVGWVFAFA